MQNERAVTGNERADLWAMLGETFWMESDLDRLAYMIEEVIAELEKRQPTS